MSDDDLDVTAREKKSPDFDATLRDRRDRKDPDATEKNDISSPEVDPDASSSAQVVRRPASSSGEMPAPPSVSRTSLPPSEPRAPSRGSFSQLDLAAADRPARLQMIVALVLGLVLVAIPLYLWRRPRADAVVTAGDGGAELAPPPAPPTNDDKPAVSEVRVLACQDPGPKKTAPGDCDHLNDIDRAITKAIEDSASCVTKDQGSTTIEFVADVSFRQKKINVTTPKHSSKASSVCQAAVKSRLAAVPLDTMQHQHARYKLSVTATYGVATK